jgi:membrane-bound metal-dependent hydrolase YbcI (DUF457 family)
VFIGHYAVGFAAKRLAPRASLGVLMAAPILLDLLWPVFLAAGWEQVRIDPGNTAFTPLDFVSYPISHSLAAAIGWGLLCGIIYRLLTGYARGAVVVGLGVVSHWVLDFVTHRPDLPLYPGGERFGLGLWNSIPATMAVEIAMYAAAVWIYVSMTRPRDRIGAYSLWAFVAFALVAYAGNVAGGPPPGVGALIVVASVQWIVPFWAWWIDRHRVVAAQLA